MSSINLTKGDSIDLSKEGGDGLDKIRVVLKWDEKSLGDAVGFVKRLFGAATGSGEYDLDAGVRLSSNGTKVDMVYFNQLHAQGVVHSGDDLTGGDGGEEIKISLNSLAQEVDTLDFFTTIYNGAQKNQQFKNVNNAGIEIYDDTTGEKLVQYDLNEDFADKIGVHVGALVKDNGGWNFKAIGSGVNTHIPNCF